MLYEVITSEAMVRYFTQTIRVNTTLQSIFGRQFFQFITSNNP